MSCILRNDGSELKLDDCPADIDLIPVRVVPMSRIVEGCE